MKTMLNRRLDARLVRRLLRRADEGQATQIEFILSLLTIMFTIFWTWEVVLAVYTYNVLSDAAKEGVRYAIVHGSNNQNCSGPAPTGGCPSGGTPDPSCANVTAVVKNYAALSLHDVSAMSVGPSCTLMYPDNSNTAGSKVNIVVTYTYVPFLALPIQPTLTTASQGRIVN